MPTTRRFPLVRGKRMRATRVDCCGKPVVGPCSQVTTEGFVSIALTATINEGEAISVVNANGATCVNEAAKPEFQGYTAEITLCDVDPDLLALMTGQTQVLDADGNAVGFRMNEQAATANCGFALEVWAGVPGQACGADPNAQGAFGYFLLPFVQGGVLGDFTIENAAVNFVITGAATKAGSGWGTGPYAVTLDDAGTAGPLLTPITTGDHLHVQYTEVAPPADSAGCGPVLDLNDSPITSISLTPSAGKIVTLAVTPVVDPATEPIYVEWGDGTYSYYSTTNPTMVHTYAELTSYTVTAQRGASAVSSTVTPVATTE